MRLTSRQEDALKELINIGVGRAAGVLNEMIHAHIILHVPEVRVMTAGGMGEVTDLFGQSRLSAVRLAFEGPFSGTAQLIFPDESASELVSMLMGTEGEDDEDFRAMRVGALSEVGNIVLNGVMGSIVNVLHRRLEFGLPAYVEDSFGRLICPSTLSEAQCVLLAQTRFTVAERCIEGNVTILFNVGAMDQLLEAVDAAIEAA